MNQMSFFIQNPPFSPGGAWGARGALSSNDPDVFFIQNPPFSPGGAWGVRGALTSNDPDVFFYSKPFLFLQGGTGCLD